MGSVLGEEGKEGVLSRISMPASQRMACHVAGRGHNGAMPSGGGPLPLVQLRASGMFPVTS